jgi:hypothetical protein
MSSFAHHLMQSFTPLLNGNIHIQKLDTCTVQVPLDFTYFEGQQCSKDMICRI